MAGNPQDELTALYQDIALARARIEQALQELASLHQIEARDVTRVMETHADRLLMELVYKVKHELEQEIEGDKI
jgi:hypothetical protein